MVAPVVLETADWSPDIESLFSAATARVIGEQATGASLRACKRNLALMLNSWSVKRINFWKLVRYPLQFNAGIDEVVLPTDTITVLDVTVRDGTLDRTLESIQITAYEEIGNKRDTGVPQRVLVNRGRTSVTLSLWPVPDRSYDAWCQRLVRFRDVGNYDGGADMPLEFFNAAVSGLAWYLSQEAEFGVSSERRAELRADYERDLDEAQEADRNRGNVELRIDLSCYSR